MIVLGRIVQITTLVNRAAAVFETSFKQTGANASPFAACYFGQGLAYLTANMLRAPSSTTTEAEAELAFVVKHLEEVKDFDVDLFREYRQRLKQAMDLPRYSEVCAELSSAASLVRTRVPFRRVRAPKSVEAPDFEVDFNGESFSVEATSAFRPDRDISRCASKAASALLNKSKKKYATAATCVFVDVTQPFNVVRAAGNDTKQIRDAALDALPRSGFGAAVLFMNTIAVDGDKWDIRSNYWRLEVATASRPLVDFLDAHFPRAVAAT